MLHSDFFWVDYKKAHIVIIIVFARKRFNAGQLLFFWLNCSSLLLLLLRRFLSRFQMASLTSIYPVHHTLLRFTVAYSNRRIFILYFRTAAVYRYVLSQEGTVVIIQYKRSNKNLLEYRVFIINICKNSTSKIINAKQ